MKNNIREILDETNISIVDELNILEYIDELEQIKEEYTKSLDKLDIYENRLDKAIEWLEDDIERYKNEGYIEIPCVLFKSNCNSLIKILRGKDNE